MSPVPLRSIVCNSIKHLPLPSIQAALKWHWSQRVKARNSTLQTIETFLLRVPFTLSGKGIVLIAISLLHFPTGLNRICGSAFASLKGRLKTTGRHWKLWAPQGGNRRTYETTQSNTTHYDCPDWILKDSMGKTYAEVKNRYLLPLCCSYKTSFMLNQGEYSVPAGNLQTLEKIYLYASSHLTNLHQNNHSRPFKPPIIFRQIYLIIK